MNRELSCIAPGCVTFWSFQNSEAGTPRPRWFDHVRWQSMPGGSLPDAQWFLPPVGKIAQRRSGLRLIIDDLGHLSGDKDDPAMAPTETPAGILATKILIT